jgi:hypothetical protein
LGKTSSKYSVHRKNNKAYIDSGIIKWNTKHIQHFQNRAKVKYKETKSIPLIHKYKTAHFPGPKISWILYIRASQVVIGYLSRVICAYEYLEDVFPNYIQCWYRLNGCICTISSISFLDQESERFCICLLGVSILSLCIWLWLCSESVVCVLCSIVLFQNLCMLCCSFYVHISSLLQ